MSRDQETSKGVIVLAKVLALIIRKWTLFFEQCVILYYTWHGHTEPKRFVLLYRHTVSL